MQVENHKLLSRPKLGILLQDFQPRSDWRVWPSQPRIQHSTARYLPHTLSSLAGPKSACHHQIYIQGWVSFAHNHNNCLLAVEEVQDGFKSRLLYAGPLDNAKVIFGVGRFKLNAEVEWFKTRNATTKICKDVVKHLPVDLGRSWSLHHPWSSPQLHHYHANARPVRELWQTSARTKPWGHPFKYFITGWHPKVQGYWRCLKNCYDPAGDKRPKTKFHVQNWKQADASVRSLANWFSLGDLAGDKTRAEMSVPEGEAYDNLLRDLTNVRTKDQQVLNDSKCFRQTPSWFEMRQKLWSSTASSS